MHVFLQLRSVLTLLSCDCRLAWFGPRFMRNMWVDAKPSEERLKSKPNRPKTWKSKANPEVQSSSKCIVWEVSGLRQTEDTTGRGEGRTVVRPGAHSRASPAPFVFFVFFVAVRLPARLSVFNFYFGFIMVIYLAYWVGRIHRIDSTFLSQTSLKKKEEEEGWWSKGDVLVASRMIDTRFCISFLNFSCFLSFFFNFS